MNQSDFAKHGGVAKRTQITYEKGERSPTAEYLKGISKIGADVNYIITGKHETNNNQADTNRQPTPAINWDLFFQLFNGLSAALRSAQLTTYPAEVIARMVEPLYNELVLSGLTGDKLLNEVDKEIGKILTVLKATVFIDNTPISDNEKRLARDLGKKK